MTLQFLYVDPNGAWSVDLGTAAVRLGGVGFTLAADLGASGDSQINIDNPDGTAGHSSDAITGHKFFVANELACAAGNRRLYPALIGARRYTHAETETDSLRLGVSNRIETTISHITKVMTLRKVTGSDGDRPAESVAARVAWIVGSAYLSDYVSATTTYIAAPTTPTMDANDYRPSATPLDVILDCALEVGYNVFLIWNDESAAKPLLWFDSFATSTAYPSAIRLSNVLAHIDSNITTEGGTKTYSFAKSALTRDPDRVASTVIYPFRAGYVTQTRAATATDFIAADVVAPAQTVKTIARARARAQILLTQIATEEDRLEGTVTLPAAKVNDLREGMLVSVEDTHAPGYTGFNSWRVGQRVVRQGDAPELYDVDLVLTPIGTGAGSGTCTVAAAVNLSSGATAAGFTDGPTTGGTDAHTYVLAPTNASNVVDGDDTTLSSMNSSTIDTSYTGQTFHRGWVVDLGGTKTVIYVDLRQRTGDPWPDAVEYWDGAAFVDGNGTVTYLTDGAVEVQRWTFNASCNSIRVVCREWCAGDRPYGTSYTAGRSLVGINVWGCS